jgi:hypothetical protein
MKRWMVLLPTAALALAFAPAAHAAFLMTPTIDFATDPIAVGSSGTGTLSFSNDSGTEVANSIERIVLEPSCRLPGSTPPCANREPGIFTIGTGTGATGTACAGISFNVTAGTAPFVGSLQFTPQTAISDMFPGDNCAITFTYTAQAVPTFDTQPGEDGVQTDQLAEVRAEHNGGGAIAFGPGTGDTTVTPAPPVTQPTPTPTPSPTSTTKKKCKKAKKRSAVAAKKCKKK